MSLTEAESQAAAGLTELIVGDFQKKGGYEHLPVIVEATDVVVPQPVAAVPPRVPSTPAPVATATEPEPEAAAEQVELPSFEPELTDELRTLLEEPDYDEEARAEIAAELEASPDEYVDVEQAQSDRAKDKRIAFLEAQLVAKSRKNWVVENLRAYPLLREYAKDEVEKFDATSRRAFARQAAELNTRLETIAKPMLADIAALKSSLKGVAVAEGRAEVAKQWGNIPGDVGAAGASADYAAKLARAEQDAAKSGGLKDVFKVMLEETPIV